MSMAFDPIHPGDVLAEQIDALGITAAEAARALGIPQSRISQILHGRRAVTADTALRLSRWLGTDDEFWMNLQARYDLDIAKDRNGDAIARIVSPVPTLASHESTPKQPTGKERPPIEWRFADAQNRFSEVVSRALNEGPQRVRRSGQTVVVLAEEEYDRLIGGSRDLSIT